MHWVCNLQNAVVRDVCLFVFPDTSRSSATHAKKFQSSYTTAISSKTSGENLKEERVTQFPTASRKGMFFRQKPDFSGARWRMPEYNTTLGCTRKQFAWLWVKIGCLHLGEEPGLWGMLGPPCGARMPWQLSVTSRHMIAVLPEPALPTMTAPRPSQLLVFLRTSSRRVKSQSRPTKGVSAVSPGTSNSSGFSIMSACLNGTSLPGGGGRVNVMWEWMNVFASIDLPNLLSENQRYQSSFGAVYLCSYIKPTFLFYSIQ